MRVDYRKPPKTFKSHLNLEMFIDLHKTLINLNEKPQWMVDMFKKMGIIRTDKGFIFHHPDHSKSGRAVNFTSNASEGLEELEKIREVLKREPDEMDIIECQFGKDGDRDYINVTYEDSPGSVASVREPMDPSDLGKDAATVVAFAEKINAMLAWLTPGAHSMYVDRVTLKAPPLHKWGYGLIRIETSSNAHPKIVDTALLDFDPYLFYLYTKHLLIGCYRAASIHQT